MYTSSDESTWAARCYTATTRSSKTLEISGHLSSGQTVFKMAAELAYLEFGDLIDKLVG